jgi:hypothetical protein
MTGELFVCDARRLRGIGSRYRRLQGRESLDNKEPYMGLPSRDRCRSAAGVDEDAEFGDREGFPYRTERDM